MWKLCSAVCLLFVTVQAGQNSIFSDFTITPSNQVAFYHYPAPPKSQQFQPEAQHLATSSEYQQQPYASIPKPTIPPQQRSFSQSYQNQYQYNNIVPQQQQQQQQHYQTNVRPQYQNYYQSQSAPATTHQSSVITQKFNSPALDSAAFTMALTNQGYTVGNAPAASTNSALSALTASLTQQPSQTSSSSQLSSFPSSSQSSTSSSSSSSKSLNVKLPLPFGVTPLNIANLPLQAGAPFAALPTGVNSYGTLYPQRKRR